MEDNTPKLTETPTNINVWDYDRGMPVAVGGFRRYSGFISNEYIQELNDQQRLPWIYREMSESNTAISSMLYAIESLAGAIGWHVEPGRSGPKNQEGMPTESEDDKAAAEFLDTVRHDCQTPFRDLIADLITCTRYGWSVSEITYKRRRGRLNNPNQFDSKYDDGRVGWGKFTHIAQCTRWSWTFNEEKESVHFNEPVAVVQFAAPTWLRTYIPLSKCVHVTFKPYMGSPEGYSPLRSVYILFRYVQRLQLILAQGADRDLVGYPVVYIPEEIILGYYSGNAQYTAVYNAYKDLATKTRRDDSEGLVLPSTPYIDPTNGAYTSIPKYRFELLSSGGSRQLDLTGILNMMNNWILSTLAADILNLGHEGVGSFALADVKNEAMKKGIETLLNRIQDAINTQMIPRLFELNPEFDITDLPKLVHDDITERDTAGMMDMLVKLKSAMGALPIDKDTLKFLLDQAGIPVPGEEALEDAIKASKQAAQQPPMGQAGNPLFMSLAQPTQAEAKTTLDAPGTVEEVMAILEDGGVFDETEDTEKARIKQSIM